MRGADRRNATTRQENIRNCQEPETLLDSQLINVIPMTSPGRAQAPQRQVQEHPRRAVRGSPDQALTCGSVVRLNVVRSGSAPGYNDKLCIADSIWKPFLDLHYEEMILSWVSFSSSVLHVCKGGF